MKNKYLVFAAVLLPLAVFVFAGIFWFLSYNSATGIDYPLAKTNNSFSLLPANSRLFGDNLIPSASAPRVALVIDDLGWGSRAIPVLEQISVSLTMALLPNRPKSDQLYRRWIDQFEFILHMPMEPENYPEIDPGTHALFTSMSKEEIRETVTGALNRYPRVVGMNNHMGSKFVAYREGMEVVMEVLAERNLFFLDSGTTRKSVALDVAPRFNVPAVKNTIFLDSFTDKKHIRNQFHELVTRAQKNGAAVGIGHIQHPNTALVLKELIPIYRSRGVEFVSLSKLVELPLLQHRVQRDVNSH